MEEPLLLEHYSSFADQDSAPYIVICRITLCSVVCTFEKCEDPDEIPENDLRNDNYQYSNLTKGAMESYLKPQ